MQTAPRPSGMCAQCGGPNPPGASVCQFCRSPLTALPPVEAPVVPAGEDTFRLVTAKQAEHPMARFGMVYFGIALIVIGIILFAVGAAAHQSAQSFNQACSQNPLCTPQSDPSGGLYAAGAIVLVLGLVLVGVGWRLYARG